MPRNTQVTIDVDAIRHNLKCVRAWAPESKIMAVVKADAYGHRLDLSVPALIDADLLAVATLEEARAIRRLGIKQGIVLLEGVSHVSDLTVVSELGLELVIHHEHQLSMLEELGQSPAERLWIKLDSGMHRLGFPTERAAEVYDRLSAIAGATAIAWLSHFSSADTDVACTESQMACFDAAVSGLSGEQCLANSAAILNAPKSHRDWVRAGILLYGISPLKERFAEQLGLKPAMTVEAELIAINRVSSGEAIGYGARYRASEDLTVGVVAIGYGDGYPRAMRDGAPVLIHGQRIPMIGRVSMDMITVDLSRVESPQIGDMVTLWGQGLPVEEVALWADTIPYELVCRMTRRVRYNIAS
jgi:alanine racemase